MSKAKKRFADILREVMESGKLVRWNYRLPEELKKDCENPEIFDKYNQMVLLILYARGEKRDSFESIVDRAIELWGEIEDELPVLLEEDIVNLVRKHVGYVDYRKCAELALRLAEEKPVRYRTIKDIAKRCRSFRGDEESGIKGIDSSSMGRVLSRVLSYLERSGLLIKTWSSRKTVSYYFRIYRTVEPEKPDCNKCNLVKELKSLLKLYSSRALRGSSFPHDQHTRTSR